MRAHTLRRIAQALAAAGIPLLLLSLLLPAVAWLTAVRPRLLVAAASIVMAGVASYLLILARIVRRRIPPPAPVAARFIRREGSLLAPYDGPAPAESLALQEEGHCILRRVFSRDEIDALRAEVLSVFERYPPDGRPFGSIELAGSMYRYEMFNRGALCQRAIEHRRILDVIEQLLGDDCHVIANTAWRNPPHHQGSSIGCDWHTDAGPHLPRSRGVEWPDALAYPIFVIGVHVYLEDCGPDDGPTGVIPGSHKSGQPPPADERWSDKLSYKGRTAVSHIVRAGDVGMFVSDVWHRRMPATERGKGRLFLQINYGRRDIAQRVLPCDAVNHVREEARARALTPRQQRLIGIHPAHFYDG